VADALRSLPPIPPESQWANFIKNHDEASLDKLSDAEREEVFAAFGPDDDHQIYGRGLRRRLASMVGGDGDRIRLVHSIVLTLPGAPVVYYGDEQGFSAPPNVPGPGRPVLPVRGARPRSV